MAEDETEKAATEEPGVEESSPRGRLFTVRNALKGLGAFAVLTGIFVIIGLVLYQTGVVESAVRNQLTARLADMGVAFEADTFAFTVSPLEVELRNADFRDKATGEKLIFVRDLRLGLTVLDLLSWKLSRDISIDRTDVSGAEVWIKFDENGRSNFSNLKFIEDERGSSVNFKYESTAVSIQDSTIHFGDLSRKIAADAKNVTVSLTPDLADAEKKRFKFDAYSKDSNFAYDGRSIEKIGLRALGTADNAGAEITDLRLSTPVGDLSGTGTIRDWAKPRYDLQFESTIDITQLTNIFSPGTGLRGVGNFAGRVTGEGENYKVEGKADSAAIRAGGVYLRSANVAATVEGTNSNYTADGKAVAEMLTFEDFRVDFPKLAGNVRGTGTDFRWVGELQAIAARSPTMSLGGLFLSDAMAEYKDRQFRAEVGNGRAKKFSIGDTEFDELKARDLKVSFPSDKLDLRSAGVTANSYVTPDYRLNGISGRDVRVKSANGKTTVDVQEIRSKSAGFKGNELKDLSAGSFALKAERGKIGLAVSDLRADRVDSNGARIDGLETPLATLEDTSAGTVIYADKLRVAKIDTGSAVLGSLNIAGVRLTIRKGTVEGTSADIDAGNVALHKNRDLPEGGNLENVKLVRPVFVLESSGRYRATADMSIGGGTIGSVSLGFASAKVVIDNDHVLLDELNARVMDGDVNGSVSVALNTRTQSRIEATFSGLDLSKLAALQSGRVIPIEGSTTGTVNLSFAGTDYRTASGKLIAEIKANAGNAERGSVPVNGNVELTADKGLFDVTRARLLTEKSELTATGRFDLREDESNLVFALKSIDASEIDRLLRVTDVSTELEEQLNSLQVEFAGKLDFEGTITGNLYDPTIEGLAGIEKIVMRKRFLGSVTTNIHRDPLGVELRNGKLNEPEGGNADFTVLIPFGGANNVSVDAKLNGVNAGNLLAGLPIDLPERINDLNGKTSGTVNIRGLPNQAQGDINLTASKGTIAGQDFDNLRAKALFQGTRIELENGEIKVGAGFVSVHGNYDRQTTAFDLVVNGKSVPLPLALAALPKLDNIPSIDGALDLNAKAFGQGDRSSSYQITFDGKAADVRIGDSPFGEVLISGRTENSVLSANLIATLEDRKQVIDATLRFDDETLPFKVETAFDQSPVSPYLAFVPQLKGVPISGTGTGRIDFGGALRQRNDKGEFVYSGSNLAGTAQFSQLALNVQDTPLAASEPILIRFNTREVDFVSARFAGGGSNMSISGVKGLTENGSNNLTVDGRINLNLLNLAKTDIFFSGFADVAVRYSGPNKSARLSGSAQTESASIATFIGSDRLTFDRVKTRVIFSADQAEIEEASGLLGGGKFSGSGGALLEGISVKAFRVNVSGDNVTVPLPKDFLTTGDATLEITGIRQAGNLQITIGGRVHAKRSLYSKDIELANIIGGRRDATLSNSSSTVAAPRFDLVIEGRDALIVRNNIADLTASVSLILAGDAINPRLSGRITANSGTLFYRKDRYEVQRGVLEFPPDTSVEPVINLQAETEISGYQIFINLAGPLNDTEQLTATLRSSPALPQADVVSLITTGSLANTAGGIPTIAQTGINTAAEILTDSIINNPARRATDKLFGLNVFEIDPIISGQQLNPSARLTVGRQINNNLRVTYSTNLSQDQNQVLALEYRVSNKLSFVAQYEQRSIANVTRNRDNFSFEVRFRRRF